VRLDCVTITGADDSIEPSTLVNISREFPFVEWGILFSARHQGSPRYPSIQWVDDLASEFIATDLGSLNLSAHLCGRWVRDIVIDGLMPLGRVDPLNIFRRAQLNFHGQYHRAHSSLRRNLAQDHRCWILQDDGANDATINGICLGECIYPLFDRSGGAGVLPGEWPAPPVWASYYGYAGGLGPDNLADELQRIAAAARETRIWIDMESRVRSDDDTRFDLAKVRRCLEIAASQVAS
jgi:hypothetical protein